MSQIRVLIVDDQAIVREGVRSMLEAEGDFVVVGEASDGEEAAALVAREKVDVVLMDIRMKTMDGLTATRIVKQVAPQVAVIMLTILDDLDYLLRAVRAGAAGYVLKSASRAQLAQAIRTTVEGGSIIDPPMMKKLLQHLAVSLPEPASAPAEPLPQANQLSERERQVLSLLVQGLSNREIADALTVSVGTVKTHVEHIMQKMQVSDRTQAAVRAVTGRWI